MIRATYVGPIAHLKGETALIRADGLAQFDNVNLILDPDHPLKNHPRFRPPPEIRLGFGWHQFPTHHWEIINEPDTGPIQ